MRAWLALNDYECRALVVLCETRGQARNWACGEFGMTFKESWDYMSVTRFPALDNLPPTNINTLKLGAYGSVECGQCYAPVETVDICDLATDNVFCSESCHSAWLDKRVAP